MNILYPPNPWCEWCDVWRLTTTPASTSPTLFEQWCGFFYVPHRLQNSRFFFLKKKSVQKSVKRGVRVLRARSAGTSHARRACEAREKSVFLASLPSLTLRFQPRSRPFVWLFALTWIHKNTDCFAVYVPQEPDKCKCCETGPTVFRPYPRRLESLTVCRCHYKGSTFFSVILRTWVFVRPGFEPVTARSADRKSPNWANQAAVISLAYLLAFSYGKSPQTSKLDGEDT